MNSETLKETEKKSKTANKPSAKIAKIKPVQKEAIDLSDNASKEASLLESLQIILSNTLCGGEHFQIGLFGLSQFGV